MPTYRFCQLNHFLTSIIFFSQSYCILLFFLSFLCLCFSLSLYIYIKSSAGVHGLPSIPAVGARLGPYISWESGDGRIQVGLSQICSFKQGNPVFLTPCYVAHKFNAFILNKKTLDPMVQFIQIDTTVWDP